LEYNNTPNPLKLLLSTWTPVEKMEQIEHGQREHLLGQFPLGISIGSGTLKINMFDQSITNKRWAKYRAVDQYGRSSPGAQNCFVSLGQVLRWIEPQLDVQITSNHRTTPSNVPKIMVVDGQTWGFPLHSENGIWIQIHPILVTPSPPSLVPAATSMAEALQGGMDSKGGWDMIYICIHI
jgi:hypothetical protein